jgi:lipopolysaccharide/colanic/teichoic acid biosynthesis glycosyltransferase
MTLESLALEGFYEGSVDEFPQLINVLKGDMSLVGPRPFFPAQKADYKNGLECYARVLPGMTGMWQISVVTLHLQNELSGTIITCELFGW